MRLKVCGRKTRAQHRVTQSTAGAYRGQLDRAVAAWADPAVWDRELDVMGAKTPAADVGALMIAELVLHGWDLAAATGQDYAVSDRAAEAADARVLDRVLALSGRDPAWTAVR